MEYLEKQYIVVAGLDRGILYPLSPTLTAFCFSNKYLTKSG
jgi:hypothetical protein